MKDEIENINGHLSAINTVLIQLITQLTPIQAAEAAVEVALERETSRQNGEEEGMSQAYLQGRDVLLTGYLDLLSAVSKRG